MKDTKSRLVEAATNMFSRYGVKRTSMSAVADEAGVSRQTLYATFNNKDELLAAAMQSVCMEIHSALQRDWQQSTSVEEILTIYFKHAVYQPFEMMQKLPDLKDLLHGIGEQTAEVAKEVNAKKAGLLAAQLTPFSSQLETTDSDTASVAKFIVATTTELNYSASTRSELDELLKTLRLAIVAMLEKQTNAG